MAHHCPGPQGHVAGRLERLALFGTNSNMLRRHLRRSTSSCARGLNGALPGFGAPQSAKTSREVEGRGDNLPGE